MIKQIILLFSLVGIFFTRLFVGEPVTITQEIPNATEPGTEFIVNVNIEKGEINGYANYSLKLPHGLSAELIESTEGNFSFKDQYINVSWNELPKQKNIMLSYKIKVNSYFKGRVDLSGIFSFIKNNKREKILTPISSLHVASNEVVDGVSCERSVPSTVAPGDIFIVKVKVNKGEITGFAKIQETLPDGFTAEAVETRNAIFSFADQKVKFLWMSLMPDAEYTVSYKVKVGEDIQGTFKIEGSFFYVENNETIKQEIASSTITVSDEEIDNSELTFKGQEEKAVNTEKQTTTTTTTTTTTEQKTETTTEPDTQLTKQTEQQTTTTQEQTITEAERRVQSEEQIAIDAQKKTAEEEEAQKLATIEKEKQQQLLAEEEAKKKHEEEVRLKAEADAKQKVQEEEQAKLDAIIAAQAKADEARLKEEEKRQSQAQAEADAKKKAEEEKERQKQQQATNEQTTASKSSSSAMLSHTDPIKGLNYRVQIAAIKTSVDNEYFKRRYKVEEKIAEETHQGWYKYTVGGYATYADAKNKRIAVNQEYGIKGPFVTAYNEGKRITVQEALMISNQKWTQ